mmetsp:Transcript_124923/g.230379  ORF Transcript_124923/g.230379 Transcript_124923/m.230379 type:complete len:154 (+) Transcript_124923:3-464(+)
MDSGRRMQELRLSYNDLQISFAEVFPTLRSWMDNIREVSLSGTGLSGHIPALRYRTPGLHVLKLADNELMGELPDFPGLHIFDVRNNTRLYGCIEHTDVPICHAIVQDNAAFDTDGCWLEGTSLEVCGLKTVDPEVMEQYKDMWEEWQWMREI